MTFTRSICTAFSLTSLAALLAACSSPPKPPTVDDSQRRPVNSSEGIALQTCKAELSASKIALTEAVANRPAAPVRLQPVVSPSIAAATAAAFATPLAPVAAAVPVTPVASLAPDAPTATALPVVANASAPARLPPPVLDGALGPRVATNRIFVVHFELGAADFDLSTSERQELLMLVRKAKYIVIRGRTDAVTDSPLQTSLAKRRAQAAYDYLTSVARFPAEGIRMTWQGAGDTAVQGDGPAQRQANRRVELEMYPTPPQLSLATR